MTAKERIEEIKMEGYSIDFGEVFNKSFELYKKIALNAGLVIILFGIVIVAMFFGIIGLFFGLSSFVETMTDFNPAHFSLIGIFGYIVFMVLFTSIISPIWAGIIKMANCADKNEDFSIGTAFDYYKSIYLKDLFLATALISLVGVTINTILEYMDIPVVGILITYVLYFFTFLTIPLIIFGNLKSVEAIQASFMIVFKQFFILLALIIVSVLFIMLGFIGFCIGIFFTMPFIYTTYYAVYIDIIGVDQNHELDEIGTKMD